jgi:hypothetical protein
LPIEGATSAPVQKKPAKKSAAIMQNPVGRISDQRGDSF